MISGRPAVVLVALALAAAGARGDERRAPPKDGVVLKDARRIDARLVRATRHGDLVFARDAGELVMSGDLVAAVELNAPPSAAVEGRHLLVLDCGTRLVVQLERVAGTMLHVRWMDRALTVPLDAVQRLALVSGVRRAPHAWGAHAVIGGKRIPLGPEGLAVEDDVVRGPTGEWPRAALTAIHRPGSPPTATRFSGNHVRVVVDTRQHLVGMLAHLDDATVVVDTPSLGRVELPRDRVWRLAWGPASGAGDRGTTLIAASHGRRVEMLDDAGVSLWRMEGLEHPHDAELGSDGSVLVVEYRGGKVSRRRPGAAPSWEVGGLVQPIDADELADGNVLVAEFGKGRVIELDRAGQVVWTYDRLKHPNEVEAVATGRVLVCDSGNRRVILLDRATGEITWQVAGLAWPMDADWLADDHVLVTDNSAGRVVEFDAAGQVVWSYECDNPYEADRLPNGNTLVVETGKKRVIEVTPAKQVVWSLDGIEYPAAATRD